MKVCNCFKCGANLNSKVSSPRTIQVDGETVKLEGFGGYVLVKMGNYHQRPICKKCKNKEPKHSPYMVQKGKLLLPNGKLKEVD